MDKNQDYFNQVRRDFDLSEDIKLTVWAAQSAISMGIVTEDEALEEFGITREAFEKYKAPPQS